MKLVEKHVIDRYNRLYKDVDNLCFLAKNLYNVGLYTIRQSFFDTGEFLDYSSLQKILQDANQIDYYALPTKVSQQILRTLCNNFKSFFKAQEEYKKNPKKFKAPPKIPKYKHKTKGRSIVIYPIDAICAPLLKENKVKLSLSKIIINSAQKNIQQVRIVPRYGVYKIEIVYEKSPFLFSTGDINKDFITQLRQESTVLLHLRGKLPKNLRERILKLDLNKEPSLALKEAIARKFNSLLKSNLYSKEGFLDVNLSQITQNLLKQKPQAEDLICLNRLLLEDAFGKQIEKCQRPYPNLDKNNIAGVDIGVNNLAAITSNLKDFPPVLINGRPLKSANQFFNKQRAKFMSFIGDKGTSRRIQKLTHKRNCIIENYLHQSSRYIINLLLKHNIGTLVIGKNDGWKQNINIGRKNNQKFVSIPHSTFVHQLKYKAEILGIDVLIHEESYTSKCSFLDSEPICKHKKYLGRRIKRGLFRSQNRTLINADVNGSANIIRKVIPNAFANGIEGIVVCPERVTPLKVKIR